MRIRRFFSDTGYMEVDTPVLAGSVIPEPTIVPLHTTVNTADGEAGETAYLLPSPEIYMKRLLAAGSGNIFQLSRCFRDRETPSRLHQPEFLMLEWYTLGIGYIESIDTTEALLEYLLPSDALPSLIPPFRRMTVAEAFSDLAGVDLSACQETEALREEAVRIGLSPGMSGVWEELFHLILVSTVEPALPSDKPLVLLDYPRQASCLAEVKKGTPWRERWELYLDGVETANCFTELTTHHDVKELISEESALLDRTNRGGQGDLSFADIYLVEHPRCSGVALGVDRLIMLLTGASTISAVMPFPRS